VPARKGRSAKCRDRVGEHHDMLTVTALVRRGDSSDHDVWLCRCDCGNTKEMTAQMFRAARSCGCLHLIALRERHADKDLTGQRFHRLLVLGRDAINKQGNMRWRCLCDCGTETSVLGTGLRSGGTKSCGCWNRHVSGQTLSRAAKECVGPKNHKYNPLLTDAERTFKRKNFSREMEACRNAVYARDKYTCKACGAAHGRDKDGRGSLVHHHIKPWNLYPGHRFFRRNCVTLCTKCHKKFHYDFGYTRDNSKDFVGWIRERRKETGFKCRTQ